MTASALEPSGPSPIQLKVAASIRPDKAAALLLDQYRKFLGTLPNETVSDTRHNVGETVLG